MFAANYFGHPYFAQAYPIYSSGTNVTANITGVNSAGLAGTMTVTGTANVPLTGAASQGLPGILTVTTTGGVTGGGGRGSPPPPLKHRGLPRRDVSVRLPSQGIYATTGILSVRIDTDEWDELLARDLADLQELMELAIRRQ